MKMFPKNLFCSSFCVFFFFRFVLFASAFAEK